MAKSKAERDALAEEQRRQRTSVVDLAREEGMTGNRPGNITVKAPKSDKEEAPK